MTNFVQVWKLMWGTEADFKSWTLDGKTTYMTADHLNVNLAAAYDRGVKDASAPGGAGQRQGVTDLGAEIRKHLNDYKTGPMVPAWVIEDVLKKWGVPE